MLLKIGASHGTTATSRSITAIPSMARVGQTKRPTMAAKATAVIEYRTARSLICLFHPTGQRSPGAARRGVGCNRGWAARHARPDSGREAAAPMRRQPRTGAVCDQPSASHRPPGDRAVGGPPPGPRRRPRASAPRPGDKLRTAKATISLITGLDDQKCQVQNPGAMQLPPI